MRRVRQEDKHGQKYGLRRGRIQVCLGAGDGGKQAGTQEDGGERYGNIRWTIWERSTSPQEEQAKGDQET